MSRSTQRLERRRLDEDPRSFRERFLHLARTLDVDLEHDSARRALQLAAQRAVAVAGVDGVLDELAGGHAAIEVLLAEEVVVDPVDLPRARVARGGRDGQLEAGNPLQERLYERSLADAGGPRDDEDRGYRRRYETSSLRCRSESPPMVLLGEMRQCVRMRFTFTRPYFGTARSRSKTLAVSTYSGGSSSRPWIWARPALRSRFSFARRVRMSFARWRASIRWVSERSGARPAE